MVTTSVELSADGAEIAWSREGDGPAIVIVHCISVSRATTLQSELQAALAADFIEFSYD